MQSTTESTTTSVSERVIERVAAATNADPIEMEPLFSRVDPDALDALFSNAGTTVRAEGRITFPMNGCEITVSADGTVAVEPQADHRSAFDAGSTEGRTTPAETPD